MVRKEKELQIALSEKEKAEGLLSNLEKLKVEGAVEEAQYESMKAQYTQMLNDANTEIEQIKNEISKELESEQRDLDIYKQELSNLEVRFKVGELGADSYRKSEQKTRRKIEKVESKLSELNKLHEAKSAADVGGFVDVEKKEDGAGYKSSVGGMAIRDIFSKSSSRTGLLGRERAGFGIRFVACFIDALILGLIFVIIYIPLVIISFVTASYVMIELAEVLSILLMLGCIVYFEGAKGGTPGKLILGLRVITQDGEMPIGYGRSFLRSIIGKVVSGLTVIGYLWIIIDNEKQGWHDKIAGTYVIMYK